VFDSLLNAFRAPDIRRRILVVLGLLIVFRFLAAVPVPGIDRSQLEQFLAGNPLFGLLNLFSGGGLSNFSVIALGMNPYINASIIMQLMTGVVPSLQALSREGEYGRNKITQYTRYLSVPMAMLQAYGFLALLNANGVLTGRFDLGSFEAAKRFLDTLEVMSLAESLGGVETLISHPATMTHASVPAERRAALGISDGLVRISVGIEEIEDLLGDLERGFAAV